MIIHNFFIMITNGNVDDDMLKKDIEHFFSDPKNFDQKPQLHRHPGQSDGRQITTQACGNDKWLCIIHVTFLRAPVALFLHAKYNS